MRPVGYKASEDTKNKISERTKKFWESPEGLLKKQRMAKKIKEERTGKTYQQIYGDREEEIKRKIGDGQKGIPKTDKHNQKNREAHVGKKRKPFSDSWRENLRKSQKIRVENRIHNFWVDGRSSRDNPYSEDWSETLRESIRQRDSHICRECGIHQDELVEMPYKLDVHHIDYDKKNCNPTNLITLCRRCHTKTTTNREFWIGYFKVDE
jgi:5-methylcytosine-specific restriction endonuclease McrA